MPAAAGENLLDTSQRVFAVPRLHFGLVRDVSFVAAEFISHSWRLAWAEAHLTQ